MGKQNSEKDISSLDTVLVPIFLLPCLQMCFSSTGLSLPHITPTRHSDSSVSDISPVRAQWWGTGGKNGRTTRFKLQLHGEERKKISLRFIPGWPLPRRNHLQSDPRKNKLSGKNPTEVNMMGQGTGIFLLSSQSWATFL